MAGGPRQLKKEKKYAYLISYIILYIYCINYVYIMISDAEKVSKVRGKRIMGLLFCMEVREGFLP